MSTDWRSLAYFGTFSTHSLYAIIKSRLSKGTKRVADSISKLTSLLFFRSYCLISVILLISQSVNGQELNPLDGDPRAARIGGSIFRAQCATCHGADAKGIDSIDAPDLTQELRNKMVDGCNEIAADQPFEDMAAKRDAQIVAVLRAIRDTA